MSGSAAFFAPLIWIWPCSGRPPRILILSIGVQSEAERRAGCKQAEPAAQGFGSRRARVWAFRRKRFWRKASASRRRRSSIGPDCGALLADFFLWGSAGVWLREALRS